MTTIGAVIDGGYCVGCGACAASVAGRMSLNSYGEYTPDARSVDTAEPAVCPFLAPQLNEDRLSEIFLGDCENRTSAIGQYSSLFVANAVEGMYWREGSSGGIGTWLAAELLKKGMVDGIIHVGPSERRKPSDPFFRYQISRSEERLQKGSHSHYHVIEMSEVVAEVKAKPGRYLFMGVPCFAKAMRRMQLADPVLRDRIVFVVALVCGHLKSVNWTLSLGWAAGLEPGELAEVKFRIKGKTIPAKSYHIGVRSRGATDLAVHDCTRMIGGRFNVGAMMLNACNYCDDVFGETADLTIGDAWLPAFVNDWRGKNMLVVRNRTIEQLLIDAAEVGRISLGPLTAAEAATAQTGGLRQRREGLAYRLARKQHSGTWAPEKRVQPDDFKVNALRGLLYDVRMQVSERSRTAFALAMSRDSYAVYARRMAPRVRILRLMELSFVVARMLRARFVGR